MRTSRCFQEACRGYAPHEGLPQRASDTHCLENHVPLVDIASRLRDEHFADELHPNDEGAQVIATEVFRVLSEVRRKPPALWTAPRFLVHLKWEITQRIYMLTDF